MNYGLYYITGNGQHVEFPIGLPQYMAPEIFKSGPYEESTAKSDIWSFGILLLELYFGNIFDNQSIEELVVNVMERKPIIQKLDLLDDLEFKSFISLCLEEDSAKRPDTDTLINHSWFKDLEVENTWYKRPHIPKKQKDEKPFEPNLKEAYYFWKLLGGDIEKEISDKFDTSQKYLLSLPNTVTRETNIKNLAISLQQKPLYVDSFKEINMEKASSEVQVIRKTLEKSFSTSSTYDDRWKYPIEWSANTQKEIWGIYTMKPNLALNSKNTDFKYQFMRLFLFKSLLKKFPQTLASIKQEAIKDIPTLLRGQIWAALLGIVGDPELEYDEYKTNVEDTSDKQLDLDIPRCHQYHELLATPLGHQKLKRVLKAWIVCEKGKQALAFTSMKAFINRFCKGFFVLDNSTLMRELMLKFRYLLSFHDPDLSYHLHHIGLGPEFYAISWFMTLYAHVFPIDKIYYLWDHFIVGPDYLFMYVGVSILKQMRDQLFECDFTNAMLLFSELSEVNVETCIVDSIRFSKVTPPSILENLKMIMETSMANNSPTKSRFSFLSNKSSIIPTISLQDFEIIRENSIIVDSRPIEKFKKGHFPTSICVIPMNFTSSDSLSFGLKLLLQKNCYTILVSEREIDEVN
ncbi:hypothetical protein HK103_004974 [Boothiomyces macroporosus]|uniref:Uncharacterized protein n=1 Tax=Boothiomyces macroporosus TaxID=261099 RepID=A0AAD5UGE9_9FUNG|nr:hypothetical protein HK103_004974 [Boothiomyces macroporosus]